MIIQIIEKTRLQLLKFAIGIYLYFFKRLNSKKMLSEKIAALMVAQVDFADDAKETAVENALVKYGELFKLSLKVEALAETDAQVEEVAGGVLDLAKTFGTAFKTLTEAQKVEVRTAVRSIVTGANEVLIEELFDAALDSITEFKALNDLMDAPLPE